MLTNLCFSYAAINEKNLILLASIVASDSLAAGIVGTVNITFLTSLVSSKYTGFQYALLTSLMAFLGKIFGGFSGVLVENFQNLYGKITTSSQYESNFGIKHKERYTNIELLEYTDKLHNILNIYILY